MPQIRMFVQSGEEYRTGIGPGLYNITAYTDITVNADSGAPSPPSGNLNLNYTRALLKPSSGESTLNVPNELPEPDQSANTKSFKFCYLVQVQSPELVITLDEVEHYTASGSVYLCYEKI